MLCAATIIIFPIYPSETCTDISRLKLGVDLRLSGLKSRAKKSETESGKVVRPPPHLSQAYYCNLSSVAVDELYDRQRSSVFSGLDNLSWHFIKFKGFIFKSLKTSV